MRRFLAVSGVLAAAAVTWSVATVHVEAPRAAVGQLCATPGKDGAGGVLSGVVNTYYPGAASVAAGVTAIPVGAPAGAPTPVAAGDLVLVIQMQGADLNATETDAYGDGMSGAPASGALAGTVAAGRYEFAVATGPVAAGLLPVVGKGSGGGLLHDYLDGPASFAVGARRFQVVRVPQYATATASGALAAATWNGVTGGVLALDVTGVLTFSGTVSVSGLGFRGGGDRQLGGAGGLPPGAYRTAATSNANGAKGEGVAGTPRWVQQGAAAVDTGVEGYPGGSQGRGAPGNAGGGGTDGNQPANDQNSGGGGGGNGGEGGRGGHAWSSIAPYGGYGGTGTAASPTALTLGGGGGAGTRNNAGPSNGAPGGGIALLRAGSIAGVGAVSADGGSGPTAANDGGGGGGAGGTVAVDAATGGLGGLTLSAAGGRGGDSWPSQAPGGFPGERHGPGGGGGGGVVLTTASLASASVVGGQNGITTTAADSFGATPGLDGSSAVVAPSAMPGGDAGARCGALLTVTKSTATPVVVNGPAGTTARYTIRIENEIGRAQATGVAVSDTLSSGLTYASTPSVTLTGGATRGAVVDPAAGATVPVWGTFSIPGGGTVEITFSAGIASTVPAGTLQNPASATSSDPAVAGGVVAWSFDPASSSAEDVAVTLPPPAPPTAVPAVADVRVTVSGPAKATRGDSVELRATVGNAGPGAAAGTVLVLMLPPDSAIVPGSIRIAGGTCAVSGRRVRCVLGTMPAGGQVSVRLRVRLGAPAAGRWLAQAMATSTTSDPVLTNNAASHAIRAPATMRPPSRTTGTPRLQLGKVASAGAVRAGRSIRFRLTVENTGTGTARDVELCDLPSSRMSFLSAPGATFRNGRACWRLASVVSGASRVRTVTVRIDNAAPAGRLRNVALLPGRRQAVAATVTVLRSDRQGRGGGVTG